ncbi:SoxR reducing system RseC family protein [Vibrio genomosp. F10]|uniref:Transcriptional regulator n=2 Tax=Vibrio genomosp. F10 TaxID=723171 RepID=A0A1B9R1S8_9VIBR|nr:SoxR reducing system RseC family protein [Vibrio genomosp. F10]OCH78236.1 transcriptional regulator [Vibrio genomosp. F10]OEE34308.1 transcriptional regulator [Vibrio genomosp. F10 str. ZF-129]OEE95076.1 transcriptional regulator [Vibrio genomosp. F10 str. 9ZD137]OEE95759.1 transcriptional regulator [Vibrio genomosp. F10 str. 9ZC157]
MMTALATVAAVHNNDQEYILELSCDQQTSCSSCASKQSCGTGIVSKAVGAKALSWRVASPKPVNKGDVVEIGFPEKTLLQSAATIYLIPLFSLILGAILGQLLLVPYFQVGEPGVIASAFLFAFAGFKLAKHKALKLEQASEQQVILLRTLGGAIIQTANKSAN